MLEKLYPWLLAARPKTLIASVVPVAIGFALASSHPQFAPLWVLPILIAALLIQIGTNVANDYYDFRKGTDNEMRIGPTRVTQAGILKPTVVQIGFWTIFAIAILVGVPLALRGGWWIVAIGLTSVACGVWYTAGSYSIAYRGMSELFVILFFGIVAVAGTYNLLTLEWSYVAVIAGVASGMLATSLLVVNNTRDIPNDRAAGKWTLPARFGYTFGRIEYILTILFAYSAAVLVLFLLDKTSFVSILLIFASLPLAIEPMKLILTRTDKDSFLKCLAQTARLQLLFGILFSLALTR
ncbi:MAG: 1,4-dihydroxy-2-naphthoate polyprenyltransferase [bacterium]|nr:1,4-dihydroxy-2-naphthoate polyprenyltransferase [bacterium]